MLLLNCTKGSVPVLATVPPLIMASRLVPAVMLPPTSVNKGPSRDRLPPALTSTISSPVVSVLGSNWRSAALPVPVSVPPSILTTLAPGVTVPLLDVRSDPPRFRVSPTFKSNRSTVGFRVPPLILVVPVTP